MIKLIDFCIEMESVAVRMYGGFEAQAEDQSVARFWAALLKEKRGRLEQFRTLKGGFEAGLVPSPISDVEITRNRMKRRLEQLYSIQESVASGSELTAAAGAALQAEHLLVDSDITRLLRLNEIYGLASAAGEATVPAIAGLRKFASRVGDALVAFSSSIVRVHELEGVMSEREERDPVTGANSQRVLFQHGKFLVDWSTRYDRPAGILLVRLDDFDSLVRQFGYAVGDSVLAATFNRINSVTRKTDWIVRNGPCGFAVLVLGTPGQGLEILAGKIVSQVSTTPYHFKDNEIPVTASVGISCSE